MKTKRTPGPWIVNYNEASDIVCVVDSRGLRIMSDETVGDHIGQTSSLANARLIAAAPELLDILQTVVVANNITRHYAPEFIKRIRDAINKATVGAE